MDILPREQQEIFLENALYIGFTETASDGSTMFMIDNARGLVEIFPSALPGQIAEVGVFEVKRGEQLIEAAELQEFPPVKGA